MLNTPDGLTGGLTYNTDVFDAPRVAAWVQQYGALLADAIAQPQTALADLPALRDAAVASPAVVSTAQTIASRSEPAPAAAPCGLQTETERQLATLWEELLATPRVGPNDNFFDLGGHSLLVMQALSRMEKRTGKRLGPRHYVFDTLRQIAREYDNTTAAAVSGKKSLLQRLFGKDANSSTPAAH